MSATGIGAAVRRKEDQRFITGKGHYTDDINRPGQSLRVFRPLAARARDHQIDRCQDRFRNARSVAGCSPVRNSPPTRSAISFAVG